MERDDLRDEELRMIDSVLEKSKLETPSSNFTHKVMMNLHNMPVTSSLSPKNGLLLLCGTVLAVTILTFLVSGGFFDGVNETITIKKMPDVPVAKNFNTISFNGKWIMNGLIMLNIVLAFVVLDRTVLRPFFSNRRAI